MSKKEQMKSVNSTDSDDESEKLYKIKEDELDRFKITKSGKIWDTKTDDYKLKNRK